jgi:uncharacterized membrane protein YkvA (DUF1232 family)
MDQNTNKQEKQQDKKPSIFVTPLSAKGFPRWMIFLFAILGIIYILNPTAGILEFIPDNFPVIGNLDEAVAFGLIWAGLVEIFEGGRYKKSE